MRKSKAIVFGILALVALHACNTTGCLENRNAIPLAAFYSSAVEPKPISLDSLQVMGLGVRADSLLLEAGTRTSTLYLPMRATQPSTGWVFSYKWKYLDSPALNDTIKFEYNSIPTFVSSECGVVYKYQIHTMSYTKHLIDSVKLIDSIIDNIDKERINIYFRTDDSNI